MCSVKLGVLNGSLKVLSWLVKCSVSWFGMVLIRLVWCSVFGISMNCGIDSVIVWWWLSCLSCLFMKLCRLLFDVDISMWCSW